MYDKNFRDLLTDEIYTKVWDVADDVIESTRDLGHLYDDVPDELKDIQIKVMEIHIFPSKDRRKVLNYLNNVPNSQDYISSEEQEPTVE